MLHWYACQKRQLKLGSLIHLPKNARSHPDYQQCGAAATPEGAGRRHDFLEELKAGRTDALHELSALKPRKLLPAALRPPHGRDGLASPTTRTSMTTSSIQLPEARALIFFTEATAQPFRCRPNRRGPSRSTHQQVSSDPTSLTFSRAVFDTGSMCSLFPKPQGKRADRTPNRGSSMRVLVLRLPRPIRSSRAFKSNILDMLHEHTQMNINSYHAAPTKLL